MVEKYFNTIIEQRSSDFSVDTNENIHFVSRLSFNREKVTYMSLLFYKASGTLESLTSPQPQNLDRPIIVTEVS